MRVEYDQEVREWGGWSARQAAIASWWSKNAAHRILHEPLAARTMKLCFMPGLATPRTIQV